MNSRKSVKGTPTHLHYNFGIDSAQHHVHSHPYIRSRKRTFPVAAFPSVPPKRPRTLHNTTTTQHAVLQISQDDDDDDSDDDTQHLATRACRTRTPLPSSKGIINNRRDDIDEFDNFFYQIMYFVI